MALPLAGLAIAKILYSLRWVTFADGKQGGFLEEDSEKPAIEDDVYPYADGINNLPDDILCNIVSRLEAIEASRTSILSRRWRKIWTMNPHLEFCCLRTLDSNTLDSNVRHASCTYQQIFLKAVDQCLKLYSGKKLKRFFLGCCFLEDYTSHVEKWIRTIAKLGVEELFLCNPCTTNMRQFTFSFQLISGVSTLRKLKLSWCNVEPCFIGPFNSLVSLTFHRLALVRDELSGILQSCPNLQFLNVELCTLPLELRISGPSLKLEGVELLNCHGLCELYISAANLVSLNISSLTTVKLSLASVLKLESLYVKTAGTPYSFGHAMRDLPQLKHVFVYARIPAKDEDIVSADGAVWVWGFQHAQGCVSS